MGDSERGGGGMVHVLGGRGLVWGFREGRGGGEMVHVLGGRGLVWGFREGWGGGDGPCFRR